MVPHIINTHLTRLSLKSHESKKVKLDTSRVIEKEDFFKLLGLQKKDVYQKLDFLLRNIQILPCSVVIVGEECKACMKYFKCRTDLDQHVKQCHENMIGKNAYGTQYDCYQAPYDLVKVSEKIHIKKSNLRLVLKIGNEVLSKIDLKRKYLNMNVRISSEPGYYREKIGDERSMKCVNQQGLPASETVICDKSHEKSKWPTVSQNGVRPSEMENSTSGSVDAIIQRNKGIVEESELSIFHQEVADIIRRIDNKLQKSASPKIQKTDDVKMKKSETSSSDIIEICLTDDDDIAEIVHVKKADANAKTASANKTNKFPDENEEPPRKKKKEFDWKDKKVSENKMKDVTNNYGGPYDSQAGMIGHYQRNIQMIDALEEMRKMEEKGFYLKERQAGIRPCVQKVVDPT